jgi:hypothetical protein
MKNVQHIKTMFPMGRNDESKVCTTSFKPGALLITLNGRNVRNSLNTLKTPNILGLLLAVNVIMTSMSDTKTRAPSMTFQPLFMYACSPMKKHFAKTLIIISIANIIVKK